MKHLTIYENLNEPQLGDYVLCSEDTNETETEISDLEKFLRNNIGQIVNPDDSLKRHWTTSPRKLEIYIWIKYSKSDILNDENLTGDEFIEGVRPFKRDEIMNFSPNKEDLEMILTAKKYNL